MRSSRSPMKDRGDVYRPREREYSPPRPRNPSPMRGGDFRKDFTFTTDHSAPSFTHPPNITQRPIQQQSVLDYDRQNNNTRNRNSGRRNGGWKHRPVRPPTHNRAIISALNHHSREKTPERLAGMMEIQTFKDLAELSESMDESEDEDATRKRIKTEAAGGDSVPRWSNPDPYALADEQPRGKKQDVVQLIRKAKVSATDKIGSLNDIADNEDYVPLDFGDDDDDDDEDSELESGEVSAIATTNQIQIMNGDANGSQSEIMIGDTNASQTQVMSQDLTQSNTQLQDTLTLIAAKDVPHPVLTLPGAPLIIDTRPPKRNLKRKRETELDGNVLAKWSPTSGIHPTPWVVVDHSETSNMGLW